MSRPSLRPASVALALIAGLAAPALAQDYSQPPLYGTLDLQAGFPNDPRTVDLTAGGSIDSARSIGGDCVGFIASAPDYRVRYQAGSLPLSFYVTSSADTTLVVNAPDGRWYCNDDYSGLDPAVQFSNPMSGQYDIWVGTFGNQTAQARLHVTEFQPFQGSGGGGSQTSGAGPDWSRPPTFGSQNLQAGFPNDPRRVDLTAGGSIDARGQNLGPECTGYIATAPDYRVTYQAGTLPLSFYVTSSADTTLVINAPDGRWYCNDDFQGLNPAVQFTSPPSGQYDIWVGTFGSQTASATLHITEFPPFHGSGGGSASAPTSGGPDWSLAPAYGVLDLQAGFPNDPRRLELTAGGSIDLRQHNLGPECTGFVATAPDYRVIYQAGSLPLSFYVTSSADTTLAINAPDGRWYCNDDYRDLDPAVRFTSPMSGQYDIWVGTFGSDMQRATLFVTEFDPFRN